MPEQSRISFHFHPYQFDSKNHAVEKSENGKKRKYLSGIASGQRSDAHSERMTEKCIKSFVEQANTGQILLYPDLHGIQQSSDIGILTKGEITPDGDWFTEYRLYDDSDNVGQYKQEKINTLWAQVCGLPPYKKPVQKGFSIEGIIPDDGIISAKTDSMGNTFERVIDNVVLDGVVLVPRPAYQDSIARAVYKALGEMYPEKKNKLIKSIQGDMAASIADMEAESNYNQQKWFINDVLENHIEKVMQKPDGDKRQQLEIIFEEYKQLMIELIIKSEAIFQSEDALVNIAPAVNVSKVEIYKALMSELERLKKKYIGVSNV